MPGQAGPVLPYRVVAGVIPCRSGWLVASAKLQGVTIAAEHPTIKALFIDVIDEKPAYSAIALYSPIGYLDEPVRRGRTCDQQARALLGPRRGASVRSAPSRPIFAEPAIQRRAGLDAVTEKLLPRYMEVAAEMAPFRQRTVFEVHPELGFYQLNDDRPLRYAKHFEDGLHERRALLEAKVPGVDRILDAEVAGATPSHLLDAAVCMWSARRILAHAATRMPEDPEWDSQGLRMELFR